MPRRSETGYEYFRVPLNAQQAELPVRNAKPSGGRRGMLLAEHGIRWRIRILLLLCSSVAALILGETVLGRIFPNEYYVWPPHLRRVFRPDPRYVPGVSGPSRFETNSLGLRGGEAAPFDTYRILAIGGSTTECEYLDQSKTWAYLLQETLNEAQHEQRVWVGNAGMNGKATRHHLVAMQYLPIEEMKINTVVLLVGVNDLQEYLDNPDFLSKPATEEQLLQETFKGGIRHPRPGERFYKRTATWRAWRRAKQNWFERVELRKLPDDNGEILETWREHRQHAGEIRSKLPDLAPGLEDYARNINRIIDLARQKSLRVIFATQPTMWRPDLSKKLTSLLWFGGIGDFQADSGKPYYSVEALAEGMHEYNDELLTVCRERNVECIDLSSMAKDTTVFYDDVHFNDSGARAVARVLASYILDLPPFAASR